MTRARTGDPAVAFPAEDPFAVIPDPANPGWDIWTLKDHTRFNATLGQLGLRRVDDTRACMRMLPQRAHSNLHDAVHGGILLALVDIAVFAAARIILGPQVNGAVTLDMASNFIGSGEVGLPLDATSEILRETGRFVFARGLVTQDDRMILSYTATLRKAGNHP